MKERRREARRCVLCDGVLTFPPVFFVFCFLYFDHTYLFWVLVQGVMLIHAHVGSADRVCRFTHP